MRELNLGEQEVEFKMINPQLSRKEKKSNHSQQNPITTTEGVKMGMDKQDLPKVMPEKVLPPFADTQLSRKEEISKGCGKIISNEVDFKRHHIIKICGEQISDNGISGIVILCPTCQARLDERIKAEQDFLKMIWNIRRKMWEHEKRFIGIKEKTCLPLDYIDDIIDNELNKSTIQKEKTE
jgi:hypothetical protein